MHLDISIIMLTIVLLHARIDRDVEASYVATNLAFSVYSGVHSLYNTYELLSTVAANLECVHPVTCRGRALTIIGCTTTQHW